MNEKLKIAHLQLLPMLSGVQQVSYQELTRLAADRYTRELVCKEAGPLVDALEDQGVKCHLLPALQRAISPLQDWRALRGLRALFKQAGYAVVHTHSSKTGFLGRLAARWAGVPCIVHTVHGFAFPAASSKLEYFIYWLLEWLAGRCCDRVIVLTESDRQICLQSLGLPAHKVVLLVNGVDTDLYAPAKNAGQRCALRQRHFAAADDELLCLMVGRMWRQKAPDVLIEAAIIHFERTPKSPLKLVLVGDGELRDGLEQRVSSLGLGERICFLGWRSDVAELLKAADMFVLPSRWEGMPLAILEAMASGVAVVASDIPGNRAALDGGAKGCLFALDDAAALAGQLDSLVENSKLRQSYADAGLQQVRACHQVDARVAKIESLYAEVLAGKSGRSC